MLELINIKMISIQSWTGAEEKIKLIQLALIKLISLSLIRHSTVPALVMNIVILTQLNLLINSFKKITKQFHNVKIKNRFYFCNMSVDRENKSSS
jgi:hypothetical protein